MPLKPILKAYGLDENALQIEAFGSGLINHTWILSKRAPEDKAFHIEPSESDNNYILQRVNHSVFKKPRNIASNIRLIAESLAINHPDYLFVAPVLTLKGADMVYRKNEGYFRLFPFVTGSHSKDVVETPEQALEAAVQFGRFTRLLAEVDMKQVKVTIPHFHDIELRYKQFLKAIKSGNKERIAQSDALIKTLLGYNNIVKTYTALKSDPEFKLRVTHHDTKISNVLFDEKDSGLCVIDLDTVMPGYFISDVGDMMRTYLSPVSEEETDFSKIRIRKNFYKAIVEGYFSEMKEELTESEKNSFFYAGTFMIYMQALRFLTDYLNDDVYYGAKYAEHNFNRAHNQIVLLERLFESQSELN